MAGVLRAVLRDKRFGFVEEGILREDRKRSDGFIITLSYENDN